MFQALSSRIRTSCVRALFGSLFVLSAVPATAQTISVNGVASPGATSVVAGTTTSFSVSGGPGNAADWVGLYAVGAPDTARLTFFFLNGTQTAPQTGVTEATLQAHVPLTAGDYEWRLFANNGLTKLATSGIVTVTASPATLRVNGIAPPTAVTVGAAAPVELTMTDGPGLPVTRSGYIVSVRQTPWSSHTCFIRRVRQAQPNIS